MTDAENALRRALFAKDLEASRAAIEAGASVQTDPEGVDGLIGSHHQQHVAGMKPQGAQSRHGTAALAGYGEQVDAVARPQRQITR